MNKGRMFGYEKKPMPEGMTFFTHPNTEESVLPLILAGTPPHGDPSLAETHDALQRALRERYAQGAGMSVYPFRRLPANFPVNLDEGSRLSSSLFDQGRQNP